MDSPPEKTDSPPEGPTTPTPSTTVETIVLIDQDDQSQSTSGSAITSSASSSSLTSLHTLISRHNLAGNGNDVIESSKQKEIAAQKVGGGDVERDENGVEMVRFCWICLAHSDEDDEKAEWVHPCHCSGTSKWVHQTCLQMWIDEKQKYNANLKVTCSQCDHQYVLVYPKNSFLFGLLEFCDRTIYSLSPIIACSCFLGSLYWSAVCYGAFTIIQVMGRESGKNMIEQSDPISLLIGLPSIPVILIFSKCIRWEEKILKLWLKNNFRLPILGYSILGKPNEKPQEYTEQNLLRRNENGEPVSICRSICGALILPTCATVCGSFFFSGIASNLQRALLGGLTFVLSKGFLKIILRQHQYIRQTHRKIVNYKDDSPEAPSIST